MINKDSYYNSSINSLPNGQNFKYPTPNEVNIEWDKVHSNDRGAIHIQASTDNAVVLSSPKHSNLPEFVPLSFCCITKQNRVRKMCINMVKSPYPFFYINFIHFISETKIFEFG
ncbi:unnamed protein product [Gordionus sp. m RMFG-2023]